MYSVGETFEKPFYFGEIIVIKIYWCVLLKISNWKYIMLIMIQLSPSSIIESNIEWFKYTRIVNWELA